MYLCSVIINKMFNPLKTETVNEELEERIERKKRMIADFIEEQKQTLNRALSEIGEFIGSYRFA